MPLDAIRFHWSQMPTWLHRGSDCLPVIILPRVSHLSREPLPVVSGTHPGRARANGNIDGTVSIRPPSSVHQCAPLFLRIGPCAGITLRVGVLLRLLVEGLIARRAVWEGRVLQKGLKGYDAYMAQVRYRLIPRVW